MTGPARVWRAGSRTIVLDRPIVVGILNVTPDSFSDGGLAFSADDAVARARLLAAEGADVIDIGGESTRPGATPVDAEEESARVIPVIERVRAGLPDMSISVDTVKSRVAEAAVAAGANIVNDVSGLRLDPRMVSVCAATNCGVVIMHSRGSVAEMASYQHANYGPDVTGEVCAELRERAAAAESAGLKPDTIVLDPGFGFSKRSEHSLTILRELHRVVELGYPVMAGLSRKRVIGDMTGVPATADRDPGTVSANVLALSRGAMIFRVHDVRSNRQALDLAWAAASADVVGRASR